MMAHLTSQERKVLYFLLFLFALGLFLSFLRKTSGGSACLLNIVSDRPAGVTLDINRASREELIALPEIGVKTADAIIGTRETHGSFTRLDELKNIKGMTDKKISRLKDFLYVK